MRIGIACDQFVEELRGIVLSNPDCEVLWVAGTGLDAVKKCATDIPDVLLFNPDISRMNGIEAIRQIMHETPCPILLVTDTVRGNTATIFEAMGCGALDVVSLNVHDFAQREPNRMAILKKMTTICKLSRFSLSNTWHDSSSKVLQHDGVPPLVVIGASAGGPKTLSKILARLPSTFDAVMIIVQHVDQGFSIRLAEWLDTQTPLRVKLAGAGERLKPGNVYLAGRNDHLMLTSRLTFSYTPEPRDTPYRPSVDVLFKSVAKRWPGTQGKAILLTGMGRDGAEGLAVLRKAGWHTIAQDQATSIVYGMPKAAKELGAATEVLALEQIIATLLAMPKAAATKNNE